MVQAANEVMQVTGVVEDSRAAKAKVKASNDDRMRETFAGLKYMEFGRPLLVAGVYGVIGLRRRILVSGMNHPFCTPPIVTDISVIQTLCQHRSP
jgi:hypothetical protein